MVSTIYNCRLKVERAKKHLSDLERELVALGGRNPYSIRVQQDSKKRRFFFNAKEPIPESVSLLIGDTVHNLRTTLDYLICGAVEVNHRQIRRQTRFPIGTCQKAFLKRLDTCVQGVSQQTTNLVRRLKPYQGGNEVFSIIDDLDIADKHNAIIPAWACYQSMRLLPNIPAQIRGAIPFLEITTEKSGSLLQNGAEFETIDICAEDAFHLEKDCNFQFIFQVAFGEPAIVKSRPIVPTLTQCILFTERVIDIFDRYIFSR